MWHQFQKEIIVNTKMSCQTQGCRNPSVIQCAAEVNGIRCSRKADFDSYKQAKAFVASGSRWFCPMHGGRIFEKDSVFSKIRTENRIFRETCRVIPEDNRIASARIIDSIGITRLQKQIPFRSLPVSVKNMACTLISNRRLGFPLVIEVSNDTQVASDIHRMLLPHESVPFPINTVVFIPSLRQFGITIGHIPISAVAFQLQPSGPAYWCLDHHDARWLHDLIVPHADGVHQNANAFIPAIMDEDDNIRQLRQKAMMQMKKSQLVVPDDDVRVWVNDMIVVFSEQASLEFKGMVDHEEGMAAFRMQANWYFSNAAGNTAPSQTAGCLGACAG